jgi:RimJ/RimL family protein N-acetyltransferase
VNPAWIVRTARLALTPVSWPDLADLQALKADPRVFAVMLGGVRTAQRAAEELADDMAFWAARGVGMWAVRRTGDHAFMGLAGIMERPDGRGMALRFGLRPEARGRGLASEAAGAAVRFAHDRAGLDRVIAVAREDNFASRQVLGAIGMVECDAFLREGQRMLVYESHETRRKPDAGES